MDKSVKKIRLLQDDAPGVISNMKLQYKLQAWEKLPKLGTGFENVHKMELIRSKIHQYKVGKVNFALKRFYKQKMQPIMSVWRDQILGEIENKYPLACILSIKY